MTLKCPGATGAPKPGAPTFVAVGAAFVSEALNHYGRFGWAMAALIDGSTVELGSLCAGDPLPMPTWDANDAFSAVVGTVNPGWPQTQAKIGALVENYVWDIYCTCNQPAPAPPVAQPISPPAGGGSTSTTSATPCFTGSNSTLPPIQTGNFMGNGADVTLQLVPVTTARTTITSVPGPPFTAYGMPSTATGMRWQIHQFTTEHCGSSSGESYGLSLFNSAGAFMTTMSLDDQTNSGTLDGSGAWNFPTGATYWRADCGYTTSGNCGAALTPSNISTQVYCGGQGPNSPDSCCPPDPLTMLTLNNILQIVEEIEAKIGGTTLGPYVDGTRHRALSGNGTIAISPTAAAIRVEIDTSLTGYPNNPGDPNYYFSLGFVTPFALGTPLKGQRLVYNRQIFSWPTYTDQIGYTLEPGLVVDLVELTRSASSPTP